MFEWLFKYHDDFGALYANAKRAQVEVFVDEMAEIADDSKEDLLVDENGKEIFNREFAARSRLRIDTRKWIACKLNRRYADVTQKSLTEQVQEIQTKIDLSKCNSDEIETLQKAQEIMSRLGTKKED